MIKDTKALSMAESVEYAKSSKDEGKEVLVFIKKFSSTSPKDGKELRNKLEGLDLMKLDEKNISKIIDLLPENSEELGKIFVGVSLDEEESKKILDAVKEFR
jgi:DNA-directed RNA polymerase subunit F